MEELFSERNGFIKIVDNNQYTSSFRSAIVTSFFNQYNAMEETYLFYNLQNVMDLFGIEQQPQVHDDATFRFNKQATITFFKTCPWYQLFDFVEYVLRIDQKKAPDLINKYNLIFRMHGCKYRLLEGRAVPIVSELEQAVVSQAMHTGVNSVDKAYSEAMELLADKVDPDYNAVIAKAANALESMVLTIAKDNSLSENTLGKALTRLKEKGVVFDPDMEEIIRKTYKYACNAGIRHGGTEPLEATEKDAVLIMVVCAAAIRYLNRL